MVSVWMEIVFAQLDFGEINVSLVVKAKGKMILKDNMQQMYFYFGRNKSSIELGLESFATECAWDYLYIYDGRSIYSNCVAAFSGINFAQHQNATKRKILTQSGTALLHFYSDKHLKEQGFNISYRVSNCDNQSCSNHGFCNDSGTCECEPGWTGRNCSTRICCPEEIYDISRKIYHCPKYLYDSNCPMKVAARASHASALQGTDIWVYGGYSFESAHADNLLKYDTVKNSWHVISSNPEPKQRFGHTMAYYNKKLFIYGGISGSETSNELWEFDILTKSWIKLNSRLAKKPVDVTGHAAVVVANKMYVFMGYSSDKSFYNGVQLFDMDAYDWSVVETKGALVLGSFGHTAVYDVISDVIFVYGGYSYSTEDNGETKMVSDMMYSFSPAKKSWSVMPKSHHPRMLHSASILGRLVIIYGGTSQDHRTQTTKKCYSNDLLAFDIVCKKWTKVDTGSLLNQKERFGHTAISVNRTAYIFGGFEGTFRSDVLPITIGDCVGFSQRTACLQAPSTANCVWNKSQLQCLAAEKASILPSSQIEAPACKGASIPCSSYGVCENCLSNEFNCAWCETSCSDVTCSNSSKGSPVTDIGACSAVQLLDKICRSFSTCSSCETHANCTWASLKRSCTYQAAEKTNYNASEVCKPHNPSKAQCSKIKTCSECTKSFNIGCNWCQSQKRCIELDAYFVNFPYGQCLEWTTDEICPKLLCSEQKSCRDCFNLPGCGWCEDSLQTGLGTCAEGGYNGPMGNTTTCPASRWHFTHCPSCNCNGHSKCVHDSVCESCANNTAGENCESCKPMYYGNALSNGQCKACYCNGHGAACDAKTGKCECDTSGVTGNYCERCEIYSQYRGNASNGGFCFYRLPVGFSYTFNRTTKNINFDAVPKNDHSDLEFEIKVPKGKYGRMNFSITIGNREQFIVKHYLLGSYKKVFSAEKYSFVKDLEPRFKVYLYGWSKDAGFQISFDQKPGELNWLHFLIVFLICFCSLLIILIVIWKLKQQYNNFRYNRQRREQLREMASRPCGHVSICIDKRTKRQKRVEPSQISLESFQRGSAAIASILIELPRTSQGYPPKGQTGLCIGSTLVSHRNQRIMINAQHQLCIFRERRKSYRHTPVNV
eukprot:gene5708-6408_t